MAKGPLITNEMRGLVAQVYLEHPDWQASEVQTEVNSRSNGKGPGLSALQKELTKLRRRSLGNNDVHDKWWSLGSLSDKDTPYISPDSIPVVLEAQVGRLHRKESPLTVREAKWVARLHCLTSNDRELSIWARFYAFQERACQTAGVPFDTTELDIGVVHRLVPLTFFMWMAKTNIVTDSEKKNAGKEIAHGFEMELLDRKLKSPQLTGKALWWYIFELGSIRVDSEWARLPKVKQESLVRRILDYVSHHQENLQHPAEILEDFGIRPKYRK